MKTTHSKIEEYNPVDGQFFLVTNGDMFAKTFTKQNALLIATAFELAATAKTTAIKEEN